MYKIMGADQREYGPVASDAVRQWVAEGRANGQTLASFEGSPWKPLSSFPEFADILRSSAPPVFTNAPYGGVAASTNGLAVGGLVLSVLGMCCLPFSLVGAVLSIAALVQIQRSPQAYTTPKIVPILGIVIAVLALGLNIIALSSEGVREMLRNMQR